MPFRYRSAHIRSLSAFPRCTARGSQPFPSGGAPGPQHLCSPLLGSLAFPVCLGLGAQHWAADAASPGQSRREEHLPHLLASLQCTAGEPLAFWATRAPFWLVAGCWSPCWPRRRSALHHRQLHAVLHRAAAAAHRWLCPPALWGCISTPHSPHSAVHLRTAECPHMRLQGMHWQRRLSQYCWLVQLFTAALPRHVPSMAARGGRTAWGVGAPCAGGHPQ